MAKDERGRTARLTKSVVDGARPEAARYVLWDSRTRGFGLRVEPSGSKTYIVRYRLGSGGRKAPIRQFKIGRVGEPKLTPDAALSRAETVLAQVKLGVDPQGARAHQRAELNVSEFCEQYERERLPSKKPSTQKIDRFRIARHIKPAIGRLRLSEVGTADVERLARKIESGQIRGEATARTRGGPAAAARTIGLLQGIFGYAVELRLLKENPAHGVRRPKDRRRERFLSETEIGRLGEAMQSLAAAGEDGKRAMGNVVTEQHVAILQLLLFTGARKNEIAQLRWSEVDFETGFLRIEDSKTGQKNVWLSAPARAVLVKIQRAESAWVFPDLRDPAKPVPNLNWAWECIRQHAGLKDVRIHDLRHTFASFGISGGQSLALIGKLLGHGHVQTTARYAHLAEDPVRAAADKIGGTIAGALASITAEVIDLKGAQR